MLLALLNARRPEKLKYRAQVTQKPAEPVDFSKLSDKQLEALQGILRTLRGEKPDKHSDEKSLKASALAPTTDWR